MPPRDVERYGNRSVGRFTRAARYYTYGSAVAPYLGAAVRGGIGALSSSFGGQYMYSQGRNAMRYFDLTGQQPRAPQPAGREKSVTQHLQCHAIILTRIRVVVGV